MPKLEFTCPQCKTHGIDEILSCSTVCTWINSIDEDGVVEHGMASNEGGYIVRYQCRNCGHVIVDDTTCGDDPLDEHALVKALKKLGSKTVEPPPKGERTLASHADLVHRMSDSLGRIVGSELVELWNEWFPATPVEYEGDSLYWVEE